MRHGIEHLITLRTLEMQLYTYKKEWSASITYLMTPQLSCQGSVLSRHPLAVVRPPIHPPPM